MSSGSDDFLRGTLSWDTQSHGEGKIPEIAAQDWREHDYEIQEILGRGGMGVVYRAQQISLKRTVALKMVLAGTHAAPEVIQRFRAEAESLARLRHPHIVPIYEVGIIRGQPFFAIEFLEGGTLRQRLRGQPQPFRDTARLVETLARAVQAAHESGIIHRDLKPENVLLAADGTPKISDFGLAKQLDSDLDHTATGAALGTPAYMAPEQANGLSRQAGPANDIYALGVMLYEMLTGRPPFRGETVVETLIQVVRNEPLRPRHLRPSTPRDLEAITLKCLEKQPQQRYRTAAELADDLQRYLEGLPIQARHIGFVGRTIRWARRRPAAAGVITLLSLTLAMAIGFGIWYPRRVVEIETRSRMRSVETAEIGEIPQLAGELSSHGTWVEQELLQRFLASNGTAQLNLGVALGHLQGPKAAQPVVQFLSGRLLELSQPQWSQVRNALRSRGGELRPGLWTEVSTAQSAARRLRAAAALAVFDPVSPQWKQQARTIITSLLATDRLSLGVWADELRPVRLELAPELLAQFQRDDLSDAHRTTLAELLASFAADQPGLLVDALPRARPGSQHTSLLQPLRAHVDQVAPRLAAHLAQVPVLPRPVPLPRSTASPFAEETVALLESAEGLATDQFAMCQTLPWPRLAEVTPVLEAAKFRMIRCRPYHENGQTFVAGVWLRDSQAWGIPDRLLTAPMHDRAGSQFQQAGFYPSEVGISLGEFSPQGSEMLAGLWTKPNQPLQSRVFLASRNRDHPLQDIPVSPRLMMTGAQMHFAADGSPRYTSCWLEAPGWIPASYAWDLKSAEYELLQQCGDLQVDVSLCPLPSGELVYSGVWWESSKHESQSVTARELPAHREAARALAEQGYWPFGISVLPAGKGRPRLAASTWRRLAPTGTEFAQLRTAEREWSAALVSLLQLGRPEAVWKQLPAIIQPDLRTRWIHDVAAFEVDSQVLTDRLRTETDAGTRRLLLLALGELAATGKLSLPADSLVERTLEIWYTDRDSGVHGAAEWLLRRLGAETQLAQVVELLRKAPHDDLRNWYVNSSGMTFAIVRGPREFWLGSPSGEIERRRDELRQHVRMSHSFAIATTEVTIEQYERFLRQHPQPRGVEEPESISAHHPVRRVTWFEAARFCRWLSEQEAISESEMCWPPLADIKPGMTLPDDWLQRTGYRLPTEAEWECACRAGTETAWSFGDNPEFLDRFAWTLQNSKFITHPVAELKPNDWGLFDLHGNLWEWCQHPEQARRRERRVRSAVEGPPLTAPDSQSPTVYFEARGGSYSHGPELARSSARNRNNPDGIGPTFGFRLIRTWKPTSGSGSPAPGVSQ